MEVALPGPLALDCEDMFKEITKKLYGEEGALEFPDRIDQEEGSLLKPEDHITAFGLAALMQNGFPPPGILHANFQPKINPAAEDKWSASDETLQWTNSRIASYNPAQKLFKCVDCECVGFLSRVAEHWLGTHSNARVFQCPQCAYGSAWARCVRLHLVREHNMPDDRGTDALVKNNAVLDEVTKYLQRLKTKVDSMSPAAPPPQAPLRPPAVSPPSAPGAAPNKRYGCPACPYATDRRDLFTRHENIHRDEKPFECYICQKQFNRADHVKKHFLRMHRDHPYDLNRIRRPIQKAPPPTNYYPKPNNDHMNQTIQMNTDQTYAIRQTHTNHAKPDLNMHQIKSEHDQTIMTKNTGSKKKGEKRYTCCYCPWSGVDNWCLKRHLNTHLKPFVCALCDYKAARSERLATHVTKVHNKKACGKCSFLAEDQTQLTIHLQEQHHVENRNIKVPNTMLRAGYSGGPVAPVMTTFGPGDGGGGGSGGGMASVRTWRPPRQQGAARLFNYMEASDGSDQDEYDDKAYPTDERSIQDFPEAGDVGTTVDEVGKGHLIATADKTVPVTSPAELAKRPAKPKQIKIPKKKAKTGNKENKSKFQCNICSVKFKTAKKLNEHSKNHSNGAQRSPLLAANSDHQRFDFETLVDQTSQSNDGPWEVDENGKHLKRSRKQSQPKKILLDQQKKELTVVNQKNVTVGNSENKISNICNSNNKPQIDDIITKIVKKKDLNHPLIQHESNNTKVPEKNEVNEVSECENVGDISEPNKNDKKMSSFIERKRSKSILNKFKKKNSLVIFKCKKCNLKFKPNHEFYLHYRYCKSKRNKEV